MQMMAATGVGDLEIGPLRARPGTVVRGWLPVGEQADGTPVRVPVALLHGARPGKTLYVQAVSDGDELNGLGVVREILRRVRPEELTGSVVAVPVLNLPAFYARQAFNPVDGQKMNRCFPGNPTGTASERIAHTLFEAAVSKADLCLDLHQGGVKPMIDEVRVRVAREHPEHAACVELARVFGLGYILDQEGPAGQLARAAPDRGVPTVDPELGGCHGWDPASIAKGVRGVMNVLRHYGFLPGQLELPDRQWVVSGFEPIRAGVGGVVEVSVQLYDQVEREQPLGTITDLFGQPREVLRAPRPGIVWLRSLYPTVSAGETVLTLGVEPRLLSSDE
jgi:predicted deacylase